MLNTQVRGRWSAALGAVLVAALVVSSCGRDGAGYAGQVQVEANNSAEDNSSSSGNNAATENNSAANNSVEVNNGVNNAVNNLPPVPEGAQDGSPCAVGGLCANGECLSERDGYVGGYCTGLGCAGGEVACTENAQCAFLGDAVGTSACFDRCGGEDGTCREGYACADVGGVSLCVPAPAEGAPDGAGCARDAECAGGTCLTEDDGFFGGMCTTLRCETRADCAGEGTACLQAGRPNYCIQLCDSDAACRAGYVCQPVQGGGFCAPSPTAGTVVPEEGELPFEIVCGDTLTQADAFRGGVDEHTVRFSVPEGTTSFMVIPYSRGGQIYPVELAGPGGTLDLFEEYDFALANPSFLINLSPLLVPQAPQFASYAVGGEYTLKVASEENLCRYVLAKSGLGSRVDLNIHLVGAGGITASSAPGDRALQAALEEFEGIYGQLGVELGEVRYRDLSSEQITRFRIVRSEEAAFQLVAQSEPFGETADAHLSVNVFFVDDFAIEGGAVLGISAGLPGAAGMYGTRGSGLVFSAAVLEEPSVLGQVLAHEVGHYLGLFHTSEQGGQGFDPLSDTPQCSGRTWNNPESCPDINNLMFPFAGTDHRTLTTEQQAVLQANPLIK